MSDLARVVDGALTGRDATIRNVVTDSRAATPGSLFVALRGEHQDGGSYVADAFAHGAAGALVHEGTQELPGPTVRVYSTGDAFLRLAADERRAMAARVVGITGANGKTSTKDMTAAVAARRWAVHASPASFNNEVGVPTTVLGAPPNTEVLVAELGARRKGDVTLLCEVVRPDIVVVTNVGVAHMEIFGSWEAIVEASAEPVDALGPEGLAILNADDPVVAGYAGRSRGRVVTFGTTPAAQVRAVDVHLDRSGRASCTVVSGDERAPVGLGVVGEHMVSNALAAVAVGLELGVPLAQAAEELGRVHLSHWRMETFTSPDGIRVVNDAYNANPESVAAALRTARWLAGDGRLIAVLGAMAELGPISEREHERVGELAARLRVDRVVTVGDGAQSIADAAIREGIEPEHVARCADVAEALDDVRRSARAGDVVVCKASRVVGLEALAEALR
jgi:UDP-N-acetylmuramoyl-tripeptide--D-alanyl-D-alanine ligase